MINYNDALNILKKLSADIIAEEEAVSLLDACDRISATDIVSTENIPAVDNSAMDGFAVNSLETMGASAATPIYLSISEILAAGEHPKTENNSPNTCVEIMTGAALPQGCDSVVRVEDVRHEGNQIILIEPVKAGSNVRPMGTDFSIGQPVIPKDTVLREPHIMALAALGLSDVKVKRKIKVAVLSTGNEIVPFNQKHLSNVQVRNSSAPFLKLFLTRHHCTVDLCGILSDDKTKFHSLMGELLDRKYDLIVTTGAVSMGKWDFITNSLTDLKMTTHFHKVAIRPGKPLLLAQSESKHTVFFGLPGNPISTAVGAQFFILPFIENILHISSPQRCATLKFDVEKPEGLECFYKARLEKTDRSVVEVLRGQASYMIHSFVQSDSWVQLPMSGNRIKAGTVVRVYDL